MSYYAVIAYSCYTVIFTSMFNLILFYILQFCFKQDLFDNSTLYIVILFILEVEARWPHG